MSIKKEPKERLETMKAIPGFHVMEWLRGVRDAEYELSVKNPKAYKEKLKETRRKVDIMIKEQKRRAKQLQSA